MFLENKRPSIGEGINFSRNTFLFLLLVFVPALHAYRTGRGDITGAGRVAGFIFSISVLMSLLRSNAVAIGALDILEDALPPTVRLGAAYYGLEPFVRKFWPQALISWSRVLRGDFRSPLTAAHILVGSTLGVVLGIFLAAFCILRPAPPGDYRPVVQSLTITGFADNLLQTTRDAIGLPLVVLLVFVLFRALLRRTWLAGLVTLTIPVAANAYLTSDPVLYGLTSVVQFGLFLVIAARYGVLALAVGVFTMRVIVRFPLTTDMSAWYAIFGLLPLLLIFAIALWSFRNALGGRQVFKSEVVV
jgi:hypothetical protein